MVSIEKCCQCVAYAAGTVCPHGQGSRRYDLWQWARYAFLAERMARDASLYAFDIQNTAIAATRQRLRDKQLLSDRVHLLQGSHDQLLEQVPDLDGVFCGNDQMAIGALKVLKEYGKRIPEEIKLMEYDDVFLSSVIEP